MKLLQRLTRLARGEGEGEPQAVAPMPTRASEPFANVPLFLAPGESMEQLRALARALRVNPLQAGAFFSFYPEPPLPHTEEGVAVISVRGSLYRGMFWDDYEDLRDRIEEALASPAATAVLLDIDSPGGRVAGCFELTRWLSEQRTRKPIWALANDQATSAAYAIASACERVFVTPAAVVGSIGAVCVHVDGSKNDELYGYKFTEIASGTRKTELSSHKALTPGGRATLERVVEAASEQFFAEVARYRTQLAVDALRALQAGVFVGADAQTAGLVDGVGTKDEVLAQLREALLPAGATPVPRLQPAAVAPPATGELFMNEPTPAATTAVQTPAPAATTPVVPVATAPAPVVAPPAAPPAPAPATTPAAEDFQARARAIHETCRIAGHPEMSGEFIAAGATVQAVRDRLLELRAAQDGGVVVNGRIPDATQQPGATVPRIDTAAVYERWSKPAELSRAADRK